MNHAPLTFRYARYPVGHESLTAQRLRELLHYEPETGVFTRRTSTSSNAKLGDQAGADGGKGYLRIYLVGYNYRAHRLAWLYMTGKWPEDQIDHRNGICGDNRFANLREANAFLNMQNQRHPRRDNTSGFLGVTWNACHGKWNAQIKTNGKNFHLGCFEWPRGRPSSLPKR